MGPDSMEPDRYTIISADCHAGGNHAPVPRVPRPSRGATSSTPGGAGTRTRSATSRTTAAPATGTTSVASASSTPTASSPRSCSRTRCPPFFPTGSVDRPGAVADEDFAEAPRRAPRPQPLAGRLRRRATRAPAPASAQIFLNDVDEARQGRALGQGARPRRRAAARRLARHAVDRPAVLAELRPDLGGVPGARACRSPTTPAAAASPTTGATRSPTPCSCWRPGFFANRALWHLMHVRRLRAVPGPQVRDDRAGLGVGAAARSSAWTTSTSRMCGGRIGELGVPEPAPCPTKPQRVLPHATAASAPASRPRRRRARSTRSASTGSCGAATTPTTRRTSRSPGSRCAAAFAGWSEADLRDDPRRERGRACTASTSEPWVRLPQRWAHRWPSWRFRSMSCRRRPRARRSLAASRGVTDDGSRHRVDRAGDQPPAAAARQPARVLGLAAAASIELTQQATQVLLALDREGCSVAEIATAAHMDVGAVSRSCACSRTLGSRSGGRAPCTVAS